MYLTDAPSLYSAQERAILLPNTMGLNFISKGVTPKPPIFGFNCGPTTGIF